MKETTIREPEQICQDCAKKVLAVIRGPKVRAVLGYFLGEVWSIPWIADLRLTSAGRIVARLHGEKEFAIDLGERTGLLRAIRSNARMAGLDGDEVGFLLAQIAKIKREILE